MSHESSGKSDEWYTPKYIFDALESKFDLDVASPKDRTHTNVPASNFITGESLKIKYDGFIWMNPPFGGRNGIMPWAEKFIKHSDGIILTPDRTSTEWWQYLARHTDAVLFIQGKVKFIRDDGTIGAQPSNGTTLFGMGEKGIKALEKAQENKLGIVYKNKL